MITIEVDSADDAVGLTVDAEGAEVLIEVLGDFLKNGKPDHVHFTDYFNPTGKENAHIEKFSLSMNKVNCTENYKLASLLTLVYRLPLKE